MNSFLYLFIFIPLCHFAWLINAIRTDKRWVKGKRQKEHMIIAELMHLRTLLPRENEAIYPKSADKFVLSIVDVQEYV